MEPPPAVTEKPLDLLVAGAGPTAIAIGAAARRAGLEVLLVERGPLVASLQAYPTYMRFFTTRDLLEIAGIPMTIPEEKPDRRQALAYYRAVVDHYRIPVALYEEVTGVVREGEGFRIDSVLRRPDLGPATLAAPGRARSRRAAAVALACGYFGNPRRLEVPGEDLPWVSPRYREPYFHYGQQVVVVGGGNSAAEAALDLWRNGARVTLVHRGEHVKSSVKYWLKPDIENRIAAGSILARFGVTVRGFDPAGTVCVEDRQGRVDHLPADAAYVLIGYQPDTELPRRCGVAIDPESLVPACDPETLETNVPGLYVAGTLLAGRHTDKIFIENTRDHGDRIVAHLLRHRGR
jgi:thioredoxin reductase (NADPH)